MNLYFIVPVISFFKVPPSTCKLRTITVNFFRGGVVGARGGAFVVSACWCLLCAEQRVRIPTGESHNVRNSWKTQYIGQLRQQCQRVAAPFVTSQRTDFHDEVHFAEHAAFNDNEKKQNCAVCVGVCVCKVLNSVLFFNHLVTKGQLLLCLLLCGVVVFLFCFFNQKSKKKKKCSFSIVVFGQRDEIGRLYRKEAELNAVRFNLWRAICNTVTINQYLYDCLHSTRAAPPAVDCRLSVAPLGLSFLLFYKNLPEKQVVTVITRRLWWKCCVPEGKTQIWKCQIIFPTALYATERWTHNIIVLLALIIVLLPSMEYEAFKGPISCQFYYLCFFGVCQISNHLSAKWFKRPLRCS